jgi:uncharacterized protein
MKIAILSDTHNSQANLQKALDLCLQAGVTTLIHCGDWTNPEMTALLADFRVISVFGNGDIASGEIRQKLLRMNPQNYAGLVYTGEIEGVPLAASHGHLPGKVDELVRSGSYRYVFHGHSHQHHDDANGSTRLINPGALGGMKREPRQFCLLDLATGKATFVQIPI